jgi:hypothetical protein
MVCKLYSNLKIHRRVSTTENLKKSPQEGAIYFVTSVRSVYILPALGLAT